MFESFIKKKDQFIKNERATWIQIYCLGRGMPYLFRIYSDSNK